MPDAPIRTVASEVAFDVETPATVVLQVAVSRSGVRREAITATLDGAGLAPPDGVSIGAGCAHVLRDVPPGRLVVVYDAEIVPDDRPDTRADRFGGDVLVTLRQSRYCPSDQLAGFARSELDGARAADVAAWVHDRVRYDGWATNAYDTAIDTLTTGAGVCRDFAHLTIALCRALGTPARLVSAYAPGLAPMDFHAVVEAHEDGRWTIVDPTRLAPRQTLVRIATGRDAADTAFADVIAGTAAFAHLLVTVTVAGDVPVDDHVSPVTLA